MDENNPINEAPTNSESQSGPPGLKPQARPPQPLSQQHILPPQKYKLKAVLMFSDLLVIMACIDNWVVHRYS